MTAIVALAASAVLVAIFAARHLGRASAAIVALAWFATMPLVWQAATGAAAQVILTPTIVASLLCFDTYRRQPKLVWLALAGACAALMLYLHLAGLLIAPAYAAAAVILLLPRRDRITTIAAFIAGFAIVAAPLVVSTLRDDSRLIAAINGYGLYDANRLNPLQGLRDMSSWVGLTARSEVYWDYFSPALWYLGRGGLIDSIIGSRVFLLPLAIPLVRGLIAYAFYPRDAADLLVLAAFLIAPIAGAVLAQPPIPPRLIVIAPLAAIIATRGSYPGAFRITAAASASAEPVSTTSS